MLPRGPIDLKFGCASQRSDGLKFGCVSQRFNGFEFGRAFQRSDGFEIWTCFLEVQWNWKVLFIATCGPFILIPAKQILLISNRVIH